MKQLVIFPRGALSPKDKERMSKEGYLAIEADDPSKVILPLPSGVLNGDALTLCALEAMRGDASHSERARFTTNLTTMLQQRKPQ